MALTKKNKIMIGVAAVVLLLILIIVVSVVVTKKQKAKAVPANGAKDIKSKGKMVEELCAPTSYQETCQKSLANVDSTDPKVFIKAAFDAAEKNLGDAIKNSSVIQAAATDPNTKAAFEVCKEVLENSVNDLKRSLDKVDQFDDKAIEQYIFDLKTWLSGAISNQEACIDAFEETTGDTGEKMKQLLKMAAELSSNGLAMMDELKRIYTEMMGSDATSRRLLTEAERYLFELTPPMDYERGPEAPARYLFELTPPWDYERGPEAPARYLFELTPPWDYERGPEAPAGYNDFNSPKQSVSDDDLSPPPPHFVSKTARRLMAAPPASVKPDVVVAQDGSGKYKTLSDVFKYEKPAANGKTYVIYMKAGVYNEYVTVPTQFKNVLLMGDGPTKTKITGNKNQVDGVSTYFTATLAVDAEDFMAKDIGIENTAGPRKKQAVALRVSGDKAVFQNVRIDGFQDTLCTHAYRQFYRDCNISGTVDFVFGDALALFQNCRFVVRKPQDGQDCMVTAQGRMDPKSVSGIVIQNGDIVSEPDFNQTKPLAKAYLGRPWKTHSKTIIMSSNIEGFIDPEGWSPWKGTFGLETSYYGEFENRGAGSDLSKRVKWKAIQNMTPQLAETFTGGKLFGPDQAWIQKTGVPYYPGIKA